jgi:hypothetical protein
VGDASHDAAWSGEGARGETGEVLVSVSGLVGVCPSSDDGPRLNMVSIKRRLSECLELREVFPAELIENGDISFADSGD